jgi:hypothetical protein
VVQLDVTPKPPKHITLMLAGPLGGEEDAGAVPVQGVLVGGPSAAQQQHEHTLYKTHRQWANHRRKVEAAAAADAQRRQQQMSRKVVQLTGSGKWKHLRALDEQTAYGTAGWTPLAAAGASDEEGLAGDQTMGYAALPASAGEGAAGAHTAAHGQALQLHQGAEETQQRGHMDSRQRPAAAAPAGPDEAAARLGGGAFGGNDDAGSKVLWWQQAAAPAAAAEEQGPLAGAGIDSR